MSSSSQSTIDHAHAEMTSGTRHHLIGFWLVAGAFFVLMMFGTTPTPLWPLYTAQDQWSAVQVTMAFAFLVLGAATGLWFFGHLSDRFGRRRVVAPALLLALIAAIEMAIWHQFVGILLGRFLAGIGVGLMAATATTYLVDLYRTARPAAPGARPAPLPTTIAAAANLGGLSLGPIVAGAVVQWGPGDPLTTPYLVLAVLLALALGAVLASPETVDRAAALTDRPARFRLTADSRGLFTAAAAVGFATFAILGIFSSVGSLIVHQELHVASPFIWGVAAFVPLAASAATQLLVVRWSPRRMLSVGVWFLPVGLGVVVYAVQSPSLAAYLIGAAIAGSGAGLLFKAALAVAARAADPSSRGGVLSAFFAVAYLGMGIPPTLLAIAENYWTPTICLAVFGGATVAVSALATIATLRHRV